MTRQRWLALVWHAPRRASCAFLVCLGVRQNRWHQRPTLSLGREALAKGGTPRAMRAQSTSAQPVARRARPPRRVVLEHVMRRDAAQRLSLALALLARACSDYRDSACHVPEHEAAALTVRQPPIQEEDQL